MLLSSENMIRYQDDLQYFDTALIPCINVQFGKDKVDAIKKMEDVYHSANRLDDRLTGRVVLFPPISFYGEKPHVAERRLEEVLDSLDSFKYVIFLTNHEMLAEQIQSQLKNRESKLADVILLDDQDDGYEQLMAIWKA